MSNTNTNTAIYSQLMNTPKEAQKTIAAGKLKGFTDINPMYRLKRLTEIFGPCGVGWYIDDVKYWREDLGDTESVIFCSINLYIKYNNEWSKPIAGIGGSKLAGKGVGDGINDEASKMAYTDAISIATKALGMCHDIYYSKDRTRYDLASDTQQSKQYPDDVINNAIKKIKECASYEEIATIVKSFGSDVPKEVKDAGNARYRELKSAA